MQIGMQKYANGIANSADPDQTAPLLLLEEQSDQCLHCLLFHLHIFGSNNIYSNNFT